MKTTLDQIKQVFKNTFNKNIEINENTTRKEVEEWDSLGHLNLIIEIEDYYNVKLSKQEIEQINSIKDIMLIIGRI